MKRYVIQKGNKYYSVNSGYSKSLDKAEVFCLKYKPIFLPGEKYVEIIITDGEEYIEVVIVEKGK